MICISALKQGIKDFSALIELDLSDNNITALPAELVCFGFNNLVHLQFFTSQNNAIISFYLPFASYASLKSIGVSIK